YHWLARPAPATARVSSSRTGPFPKDQASGCAPCLTRPHIGPAAVVSRRPFHLWSTDLALGRHVTSTNGTQYPGRNQHTRRPFGAGLPTGVRPWRRARCSPPASTSCANAAESSPLRPLAHCETAGLRATPPATHVTPRALAAAP